MSIRVIDNLVFVDERVRCNIEFGAGRQGFFFIVVVGHPFAVCDVNKIQGDAGPSDSPLINLDPINLYTFLIATSVTILFLRFPVTLPIPTSINLSSDVHASFTTCGHRRRKASESE
jgi:hypothetical protein